MSVPLKTAIVTGASQGIGAGIVKAFVERGFNVVANSRKVTQSSEVAASDHVALVDGDIGQPATAAKVVETALWRFQSIDGTLRDIEDCWQRLRPSRRHARNSVYGSAAPTRSATFPG